MLETMYDAPGIGLAAIQVGVPKRVIVVDVAKREGEEKEAVKEPIFLVNPKSCRRPTRCPSMRRAAFRSRTITPRSSARARSRALSGPRGRDAELDADGILATCLQHEIDHLNGVLFIDYLSRLKRDRVIRRFEKDARRRDGLTSHGENGGMALRVVFMGTPAFSVPTLAAILDAGHHVVACYTRAPKPAGRRGLELTKSPVHVFAEERGIPVFTPRTLRDEAEIARFASHDADVGVVIAYGLILPKPVLDAPRQGCLNLHASLLPRWRGAAPIQRQSWRVMQRPA